MLRLAALRRRRAKSPLRFLTAGLGATLSVSLGDLEAVAFKESSTITVVPRSLVASSLCRWKSAQRHATRLQGSSASCAPAGSQKKKRCYFSNRQTSAKARERGMMLSFRLPIALQSGKRTVSVSSGRWNACLRAFQMRTPTPLSHRDTHKHPSEPRGSSARALALAGVAGPGGTWQQAMQYSV